MLTFSAVYENVYIQAFLNKYYLSIKVKSAQAQKHIPMNF